MKGLRYFSLILLALLLGCRDPEIEIPKPPSTISLLDNFYVEINLNDREDDTFKVNYFMEGLTEANSVFQFAAVVPGTYSISDIGRFVTNFTAFDEFNQPISTEQTSTNQWVISDPENVYRLQYEVAETFQTEVAEHQIYKMAGTSIENSYVLLNTFDVIGYPEGLKERDFFLNIKKPSSWKVGTSLQQKDNYYYADNFDHLVDSPLLLGELSEAEVTKSSTTVKIYSYSPKGVISAGDFTSDINSLMNDAEAFLKTIPVNQYSFILLFSETGAGALEHSYSSVYVLSEISNYPLKNIAAHEFFHIVTPLNIHSEIIENFNFATPTPSEHLWLYEGVTEWAAHIMQLRNSSIDLNTWIQRTRQKINSNSFRDPNYSLNQMSKESFSDKGQSEYGYIYTTGALVATFLDIRLLELSQGTFGLRELMLELIQTYGKTNPFPEDSFYDVLVQLTYPEIGDFINRYIKGTDPLPIAEYFLKIGLEYDEANVDLIRVTNPTPEQTKLFEKWSVNLN